MAAVRSGQPAQIDACSRTLRARAATLPPNDPATEFLLALADVVAGTPAADRASALAEPWRGVLLRVAADCTAPEHESDWVPAAAARVAQVLRRRDRAAAASLADQLAAAAELPDLDAAGEVYLRVLIGVLHGADVRATSLRLVEPYRSAYFSMQELVRGADPRAGLIERVRDNALLVLRSHNAEARAALALSLADVEDAAATAQAGELTQFVSAVRALVAGEPATRTRFDEPDLAAAWITLRQADTH